MGFKSKLTEEQREGLWGSFEEVGPDNKPLTIEDIAKRLELPTTTVAYYHRQWKKQKDERDTLGSTLVQPDPVQLFQRLLDQTPGVGPEKIRYAMSVVQADPSIFRNPPELEKLLRQGLNLAPFAAEHVLKAVWRAAMQEGGASGTMLMQPGMPPQPGMMFAPGAPGAPWGAPYPPPYAQPGYPSPYYPPYGMPWGYPPGAQGLDKATVQDLLDAKLDKKFEEFRRSLPAPAQDDKEYEETQEPVLGPTGQPLVGPDGQPIFRFVRRPVRHEHDQGGDVVSAMAKLKESGLIQVSQRDPAIEAMLKNQEQLIATLAAGPRGADPEMKALLEKIRDDNAKVQAELAAERARREAEERANARMEKVMGVMEDKERQLREKEIEAVIAKSGMPAEAQILNRAIDTGDKTVAAMLENTGKRIDKLETLAIRLLTPATPGVPIAPDEADLAAIVRRQQAIDAAEEKTDSYPRPPPRPRTPPPAPLEFEAAAAPEPSMGDDTSSD